VVLELLNLEAVAEGGVALGHVGGKNDTGTVEQRDILIEDDRLFK
jgi:hypothetical protein